MNGLKHPNLSEVLSDIEEPGFWVGERYMTPMKSEVKLINKKKSVKIPKKVLRGWREIVRMNFNQ